MKRRLDAVTDGRPGPEGCARGSARLAPPVVLRPQRSGPDGADVGFVPLATATPPRTGRSLPLPGGSRLRAVPAGGGRNAATSLDLPQVHREGDDRKCAETHHRCDKQRERGKDCGERVQGGGHGDRTLDL